MGPRVDGANSLDSIEDPQSRGSTVRFTIHKSAKNGQFWFRIVESHGQVLATSEMYATKASVVNAIESIKKSAGSALIVDETVA
jgi:hypothetical protein